MTIPTDQEILKLLDRLEEVTADELESHWLEFKPWHDPKDEMRVAVECAVCFANAEGGVIAFGVDDRIRGRSQAIHGASRYSLDAWKRGIFDSTNPNIQVEVSELTVPEGTGKLLLVRVPQCCDKRHSTSQGLAKIRIGKNCMPMDPDQWTKHQISTGAID